MGNYSLKFRSGNRITIQRTITENGIPVNFDENSLDDATYVIADSVTAPSNLVTKTLGNGIEIIDSPGGVIEITLEEIDTEELGGDYYHECEVTINGGDTTIFEGTASIVPTRID